MGARAHTHTHTDTDTHTHIHTHTHTHTHKHTHTQSETKIYTGVARNVTERSKNYKICDSVARFRSVTVIPPR